MSCGVGTAGRSPSPWRSEDGLPRPDVLDAGGIREPCRAEPRLEAPRTAGTLRAAEHGRWEERDHAVFEQLPEPLELPEGEACRTRSREDPRGGKRECAPNRGQHGPARG